MHAKIIQLSKKRISKDEYIDKDGFELEDYGKYNIDYIDDIEKSARKEEIASMEREFPIKLFEVAGPNKVRFIDNTWELKNLLFSRIKSTIQETDVVRFFDSDKCRLTALLQKPFTDDLFVIDGTMYSSYNLIDYALRDNFSDGDTIYVGNILDYHSCIF